MTAYISTGSSTSSELEAILRRKALQQLTSGSRHCCVARHPVGYGLSGVEELGEAVKSCRVAFVMFFEGCPYCKAFDPI